jgi:glycopeptide antibiotics resistance protein
VFLYAKEHHWRINNFLPQMAHVWCQGFRSSSIFRRIFLLVFYTTMILFRTVLNRQIWFDPLGKVMGGWGLYDADGNLTTESIENFMLFVPFTVLLFGVFREQILGEELHLKDVIWKSIKIVGIFSLIIEFVQVLFHLGTFQVSDLCYNTFGGMCGGLIYFCLYKLKK